MGVAAATSWAWTTTTPADATLDAWLTVLVMDVWHWTPLVSLLCLRRACAPSPSAFYQAARIDGASASGPRSGTSSCRKLRGVLTIAVLLRFMDSFMIYTEPFVLTGGGPGNATTFLSQYLTTARPWDSSTWGPAAAFSLIYFFLVVLLFSYIFYNRDDSTRVPPATKEPAMNEELLPEAVDFSPCLPAAEP